MKHIIWVLLLFMTLVGCGTDYPCGEPRVGRCSSVSENIVRSDQKIVNPEDLPINPHENCSNCGGSHNSGGLFSSKPSFKDVHAGYPKIPSAGSPLVSSPSMIRVWFAPYVDADNVYHEQGYEYMLVDRGHWMYGQNQAFGKNMNQIIPQLVQGGASANDDEGSDNKNDANKNSQSQQGFNSTLNTPNTPTPALNYLKQSKGISMTGINGVSP